MSLPRTWRISSSVSVSRSCPSKQDLAARRSRRAAMSSSRMIGQRGDALAAARLAHDAERLAALDREVDAVDGLDGAVHDVEVRPQVAHVEQQVAGGALASARAGGSVIVSRWSVPHYSRLRGSRASRRPSPMKLIAITVRAIAMPGKNAHHQLPSSARSARWKARCPS